MSNIRKWPGMDKCRLALKRLHQVWMKCIFHKDCHSAGYAEIQRIIREETPSK